MTPEPMQDARKRTPAARVNSVLISQHQIESGLQTMLEPYRDAKGKVRLSQEKQYEARKKVIDTLIKRELLYQEGCRQGISAGENEINEAMLCARQEYQSEQQFEAVLSRAGLSHEEYRRQVEHDIIINKFAASLVEGKRTPITTDEARQYYEGHIDEMTGAEVRRILHLSISLDRYATDEEEQKARKRLEKLAASKEVFENTIQSGGGIESDIKGQDLGFVVRGQMHPLLESVAFRMAKGVLSRIIRTEEGLHVLLVKTILEQGKTRPFELIEEELKKKIYEMRSISILNDYTDRLRKKARIELFDRMAESKLERKKD